MTIAIRGLVWHDINGDGAAAAGEPGLLGVQVRLFIDDVQVDAVVTGGDGRYEFGALLPDAFVIREVQPVWLRWSTTPDELAVDQPGGGIVTANFGDWNGRPTYLPLILR